MKIKQLVLALIVTAVAIGPLRVANSADATSERLARLGANEWLYLEPQPSPRLVLQKRGDNAAVQEVTTREPAFREYTSPAFGDGKIYYFGGGHGGYFGNDVEEYDPANNRWRQCYRPVCPPTDDTTYFSGGSERSYVDPETGAAQPYVIHGYARSGYDPGLHRYVCTAMFPTKVERDAQSGKWRLVSQGFGYVAFDPATNRWELLSLVPDELKPGPTSLSYNSQLGGVVAFSERSGFLFHDGKWVLLGSSAAPLAASGGAAASYVPEIEAHVIAILGHGGAQEIGKLSRFSTAGINLTEIAGANAQQRGRTGAALPTELARRVGPGTGGFNLIMSYDAAQRKLVFMSVNDELRPDVWTYAAASDRWEQLPASPTAPKLFGIFEPGRGRAPLVYDPVRKLFFLVYRRGESVETWAYRLADVAP